jgi:ribose transport system substrate-binding protein
MKVVRRLSYASLVAAILAACALAVAACHRAATPASGAAAPARTERYATVVFLSGSEFFNWAYAGMRDAARMLGPHVQVELRGPAEWDASLEARTLEELTARRIDGVAITAAEANAVVPAIDKAIATGISVITFDSDSPGSKRLAFVGTNNYNAGWAAGKAMAEWLGGTGEVGISTFPGPDHLKKRLDGFTAGLARFGPGIKIAAIVNDEGDVAKAETQVTAMLQANPGIKGIFCAHGNPGPGAAAAVRNLGLKGKVQILAFDFGTPVIELIQSGEIKGTVGQNPYLMGYMSMLLAYSARHPAEAALVRAGFGPVPDNIDTGVTALKRGRRDFLATCERWPESGRRWFALCTWQLGRLHQRARLAGVRDPVHARAVIKRPVPAAAPLRGEIEHVVDRLEQVYPALIHVVVEPRVRRVEMPQRPCGVAGEDAEGRILAALRIFAPEVVFERAVASAQQAQVVPTARPRMGAERRGIGGGHDRQVDVLGQMRSDTVERVDPHRAHRAGGRVSLSIHEVVDDQRPPRAAEQLAQMHRADRTIGAIEVSGTLLEHVVDHLGAGR